MSNEHPPHVYQDLANFTEYQSFEYKFDFVTVISSISFLFFIPSFACTAKMLIFYYKNPKITVSSNRIHPYIFKSFITMQLWNTLNTIIDFLVVRIPTTTIFTSVCVRFESDTFYRYIYAGLYFTFDNAQLYTVLFCLTRVLILYTLFNQDELCKKLFIGWSILTYFLSLADSVPNIPSEIVCMQLDTPFQEGAISISSTFIYGNNFMNVIHFVFSTGIIISIVISTFFVLIKLRNENLKKTNKSLSRTKAETTLTVTTILIIIPLFVAQGLTVSSFLNSPYFSYILSIRPLMLDLRVNVVSIYFYTTHPVFKKKKMSPGPSAMFGSSTL